MMKVCLGFYNLTLNPQIKIHFCQGDGFTVGTLAVLWLLTAELNRQLF